MTAEMGYRTGQRSFPAVPHEFDLIVCDLRRPACYDMKRWGLGNDNYHVEVVPYPEVSGEVISRPTTSFGTVQYQPRFRLIDEMQIEKASGEVVGPPEVFRAITVAGVPAVLFLNPEWLSRIVVGFPSFLGLTWIVKPTRATLFQMNNLLRTTFGELGTAIELRLPLQCAVENGPFVERPIGRHMKDHPLTESLPLLTNAVDETFAQYSRYGKGAVWLLPATLNNAEVARLAAERVAILKPSLAGKHEMSQRNESDPKIRVSGPSKYAAHDVFISHASEDKEGFVRPLALALRKHGLNVWYDEFSLTVGDSLRESIDKGLNESRYGIVVLSKAFFEKRWPKSELEGMVAMQNARPGKYILPVWYGVGEEDVRQFSPMLLGKVAARSIDGLEVVARCLLEVIRKPSVTQPPDIL